MGHIDIEQIVHGCYGSHERKLLKYHFVAFRAIELPPSSATMHHTPINLHINNFLTGCHNETYW